MSWTYFTTLDEWWNERNGNWEIRSCPYCSQNITLESILQLVRSIRASIEHLRVQFN
jgi:hypothetical protein